MIEGFLAWWARRLLELVPARLLEVTGSRTVGLTIELLDPPGQARRPRVQVLLHRRRDVALGQFILDEPGIERLANVLRHQKLRAATVLRLPPRMVLDREVVLPLAAERDPQRILGYEMDRLTPFSTSEVYWTWQTERRDRALGRLCLRLSLVPKATLQPLLAALQNAGVLPTSLQTANIAGPPTSIEIGGTEAPGRSWQRYTLLAVAAACAVLAVLTVAMPFIHQAIAGAAVDRAISELRPQVAQVEALRRRLAASAAETDVIAGERAKLGDTLRVLAALTDILPDDAYLTDFTMRQGKIEMRGQAGAAAKLIAALSADPVIRNPAFAAPVNRLDSGRGDIFSIRAEAAP